MSESYCGRRVSLTNPRINDGVNIGHSSRLGYDKCAYEDRLEESVSPLLNRVNPHRIHNCDGCLSVFGPRSSYYGYGVSTTTGHAVAAAQSQVDVESVLSNRNVLQSKCKDGRVNEVDLNRYTLQHARICNDFLDPVASRLTNPATNYRGMAINRFYDLDRNPQTNIFWDFNVNTDLEAKDNYRERVPNLVAFDPALPKELKGRGNPCPLTCTSNCPTGCDQRTY